MESPEAKEKKLFEDGVFWASDSHVGDDVAELEKRGFPYYSEYSLDVCQRHVLNEQNRYIIRKFFGDEICTLAHWLRYTEYPGHIQCFRIGGPKAGRRRLVIQLLAKGSKVAYWKNAHNYEIPASRGARLLHELSEDELIESGSQRQEEHFPFGGIAVFDGRVGFEINEGYAITFEFATLDVVQRWPSMPMPNSPGLAEKVAAMQSPSIQINFTFENPT